MESPIAPVAPVAPRVENVPGEGTVEEQKPKDQILKNEEFERMTE
jgi:hypothetical protein